MNTKTTKPVARRWTAREYHRLADQGWFANERVELLFGRVVQMPPQRDTHVVAVGLTTKALEKTFGAGYWVRVQCPLLLGKMSEPEPDVAVVVGQPRDYLGSENRADALLIVEVSDTTLAYDRSRKLALFSRFNISEYWIVNLVENQLEVYRDPTNDPLLGPIFRTKLVLSPPATISPLAAPHFSIPVADLLP